MPNDSLFIGNIDASREFKLTDLKEQILTMPHFTGQNILSECLRLRVKNNNGFFGRIYRDEEKTLKQLSIKDGSHLVV